MRYNNENKQKANGVVYTPTEMANYLASEMIHYSKIDLTKRTNVTLLDPAIGEGELLISIIKKVKEINPSINIKATGFETDKDVAKKTQLSLCEMFPDVEIHIIAEDFLDNVEKIEEKFDFIIANPPYVRTQILGSDKAQKIAKKMGLTGRVDIYYAFLLYMKQILSADGISGYITSNKFFTIKAGASVRDYMIQNYTIHSIVDFGDTKLFTASVLPCIVVFSIGTTTTGSDVNFTSTYEVKKTDGPITTCNSIFDHIHESGIYSIPDGRIFQFQQGTLNSTDKGALWILASNEKEEWLKQVESNTLMHFSDLGKIRVGIKTTADNVFIGDDWTGENSDIELLKPLITHRDAGQIISRQNAGWKVLYTHTIQNGKKVAYDINLYPKAKKYLESHYKQLAGRKYVQKAKRNWYEIWVPQNPGSWANRKIVFRDISEKPEFWLDESGAIVNGDCYWIEIDNSIFEETIYLALAIANSSFIEKYYDYKFNTKLYSGKRRYMSQYVEQFPIPFTNTAAAHEAISLVKTIITECSDGDTSRYMDQLNILVEKMFNL